MKSVLLFLILALPASAVEIREETGWGKFFESRKLVGTMVVLNEAHSVAHVWNVKRAETPFSPASTFKIPNALIALDAKVVKDLDEVIPYGGTKEFMKEWERDMNLREAMKLSNVAVFHQVARRIGLERMREKLVEFDYGNQQIGDDIDHRFWLEQPLQISAMQQVEFLAKLAQGKLPVSAESVAQVKEITRYGEKNGAVIYAKTGWTGTKAPQTGWWVGWVEKEGKIYPFAMNAVIPTMDAAKLRIPTALDCLDAMGIY
ncbi:MAG: class D beta-lactamase [Verrucomicrobiota bacterium]